MREWSYKDLCEHIKASDPCDQQYQREFISEIGHLKKYQKTISVLGILQLEIRDDEKMALVFKSKPDHVILKKWASIVVERAMTDGLLNQQRDDLEEFASRYFVGDFTEKELEQLEFSECLRSVCLNTKYALRAAWVLYCTLKYPHNNFEDYSRAIHQCLMVCEKVSPPSFDYDYSRPLDFQRREFNQRRQLQDLCTILENTP